MGTDPAVMRGVLCKLNSEVYNGRGFYEPAVRKAVNPHRGLKLYEHTMKLCIVLLSAKGR